MAHMPGLGAGDDFFHVLELRLPAEFGADFFRAGDESLVPCSVRCEC